jgi:Sec-independent protein translocase protein TatA
MTNQKWTALLLIPLVVVMLCGCNPQNLSALVKTVGESVVQLGGIITQLSDPNLTPEDKQKMVDAQARAKTAVDTAATLIAAWQQGTPANEIINELDVVQTNLSQILSIANVVNPTKLSLIETAVTLAIGTIQLIISMLPASPAAAPKMMQRKASVPVMITKSTPKNAKEYKTQWNAIMDKEGASGAKLK